jgi:hypothetical protein
MCVGGVINAAGPFLLAYWLSTCVHEAIHLAVACLVGHARSAITLGNLVSATCSRHVCIPAASGWRAACIRHAGWVGSLLFAVSLSFYARVSEAWAVWQAAAWLTALDSMCSDLLNLNLEDACAHGARGQSVFRCGNFGLVLLGKENRNKVLAILKEMVRITMMRGAQSGGVITYVRNGSKGVRGVRSRVVNGKVRSREKLSMENREKGY